MVKVKKNSMTCYLNFPMEIDMKSLRRKKLVRNIRKKWRNCCRKYLIPSNMYVYVGMLAKEEG